MRTALISLLFACFALESSHCIGQSSTVTKMDSLFSALDKYHFIYGNVLVAENGNVVYKHSYGYSNINEKIHNNDGTTFELASLSKVFTAVAVMQLYEKRRLTLDDKVAKFLPEFPYPSITIRQLLSHTSGLPDFEVFDGYKRADSSVIMTNEDIVPALKRLGKADIIPGRKWSYSSPGIGLLAMIVEKITGQSFSAYLTAHIFKPAGMKQTYLNSAKSPVNDEKRAIPYALPAYYSSDLVPADTMNRNKHFLEVSGGVVGPGLLVSSTGDLYSFDRALFSGKLLKKPTLDTMLTPVKLTDGSLAKANHYPGDVNFGLGWFIYNDPAMGKVVFHSGFKPGTGTILLHALTKNQTIILLDHGSSPSTNVTAFNALSLLNGRPAVLLKSAVTFSYGDDLLKKGPDYAAIRVQQLRQDTVHYTMAPVDWIAVGYDFYRTGYTSQALETFKTGYTLYPDHPFLCQVYADVLAKAGKKDEAVMLYQKCLKLNPDNKEAAEQLKQLQP